MSKFVSLIFALMLAATAAVAQYRPGWWVIVASIPTGSGTAASLGRQVVSSASECGVEVLTDASSNFRGFRPGFNVYLVGPYATQTAANEILARAKRCVPDAYIKFGEYLSSDRALSPGLAPTSRSDPPLPAQTPRADEPSSQPLQSVASLGLSHDELSSKIVVDVMNETANLGVLRSLLVHAMATVNVTKVDARHVNIDGREYLGIRVKPKDGSAMEVFFYNEDLVLYPKYMESQGDLLRITSPSEQLGVFMFLKTLSTN